MKLQNGRIAVTTVLEEELFRRTAVELWHAKEINLCCGNSLALNLLEVFNAEVEKMGGGIKNFGAWCTSWIRDQAWK